MSKLTFAAAAMLLAPAALVAAPMSSATYVTKAGAGDLYEIQSSKLVLQSTANPGIKTFAQMMVTDHIASTADVKAAARRAKVTVAPPKLNAMQAHDLAALRAAKGADRDTLYVTQQKAAHQEALTLHQGEAENGTAAPLKAAATKIVTVVQHHIDDLASL